jgi:hypothetical protein
VFNQFTEQFSVNQLADIVKREGAKLGLDVQVGGRGRRRRERRGAGKAAAARRRRRNDSLHVRVPS